MNIERLKTLIESYGANSSRWPKEEQQAAVELLNSSELARHLMDEESQIDKLLDGYQSHAIDRDRLQNQILTAIDHSKPGWADQLIRWLSPDVDALLSSIWRPTLAAAMTLTLGVSIGMATVEAPSELTDYEEIELMALSYTSYDGWNDE